MISAIFSIVSVLKIPIIWCVCGFQALIEKRSSKIRLTLLTIYKRITACLQLQLNWLKQPKKKKIAIEKTQSLKKTPSLIVFLAFRSFTHGCISYNVNMRFFSLPFVPWCNSLKMHTFAHTYRRVCPWCYCCCHSHSLQRWEKKNEEAVQERPRLWQRVQKWEGKTHHKRLIDWLNFGRWIEVWVHVNEKNTPRHRREQHRNVHKMKWIKKRNSATRTK